MNRAFFLPAIVLAFLLSACVPLSGGTETEAIRVNAAVSFFPLEDTVSTVGGPYVRVSNFTYAGAEVHDFEPSPRDLADASHADLLVLNGAGLDDWADALKTDVQANGGTVIVLADSAQLVPAGEEGPAGGHAVDPHIWLDPGVMIQLTERVREALSARDPEHASVYAANAAARITDLRRLDADFASGFGSCALSAALVAHDAFSYLSRAYRIHLIPISGISHEEEPSPRRLAELTELARVNRVSTVFFETAASPRMAETLAREVGATTAVLNPAESLTAEERAAGLTYITLMRQNLQHLKTAFQCT